MKKLATILLAGLVSLSGCGKDYEKIYEFEGEIEGEKVYFFNEWDGELSYKNFLKLEKPDGSTVLFTDYGNDLKIDRILIKPPKRKETSLIYINDGLGKPILEEGQKIFDKYLKKIKEIKINQGLEAIK